MGNRKPLLETFENSSKLLAWFIKKVNFKIWNLLWTPKPKLYWNQFSIIALRTFQLIFAIPVIIADFLIILSSVFFYLLSIIMILLFFLIYAVFMKILEKLGTPIFTIFGIVIAITTLYVIIYPESWQKFKPLDHAMVMQP